MNFTLENLRARKDGGRRSKPRPEHETCRPFSLSLSFSQCVSQAYFRAAPLLDIDFVVALVSRGIVPFSNTFISHPHTNISIFLFYEIPRMRIMMTANLSTLIKSNDDTRRIDRK